MADQISVAEAQLRHLQALSIAINSEVNVAEKMAGQTQRQYSDSAYERHMGQLNSKVGREVQSIMSQIDKEESMIVDPYGNPCGKAPLALTSRKAGYMPGNDEEEEGLLVLLGLEEMYKYFTEKVPEHYRPLMNVRENSWGFVKGRIMQHVWKGLEDTLRPQSELLANIASGLKISNQKSAQFHAMDLSPLMGRLVTGYAPGKSYIENVWIYNKEYRGTIHKVPVFFSTFDHPVTPTEDKLKETIQYVDANLASPYDSMGRDQSAELVNTQFITMWAEGFTWPYKKYFEPEPTIHRWFAKGDTKGSRFWTRQPDGALDSEGTEMIPAALRGKIELYRKNAKKEGILYNLSKLYGVDVPVSPGIMWSNVWQDIYQDVAFTLLGGIPIAKFLESIGAEDTGIRNIMEIYYKMGENLYGLDMPFSYNIRDEYRS